VKKDSPQAPIPDKLYFKIGEVSKIVAVKPYVLRYWETEFKELGPLKSRSNQRLYRRKDVELLVDIKRLLYSEGFTISGARKQVRDILRGRSKGQDPASLVQQNEAFTKARSESAESQVNLGFAASNKKFLEEIHKELTEIKDLL
jgi:DNA-binding transcriptional MerR regulator